MGNRKLVQRNHLYFHPRQFFASTVKRLCHYVAACNCIMFCDYHAFGHALSMASGCGYMRDIGQYSNREKVKLVLYKYKYYCLKRGVFFMEKTRSI